MKKFFAVLLTLCLMVSTTALAEIQFDITPFENDEAFQIEFDDMDDTGTITAGVVLLDVSEDSAYSVAGTVDVRIIENQPPVIRLTFMYIGDDWCFVDKMILKPGERRYSFDVKRDTDIMNGKVFEMFTVVITDDTIGLIEDLLKTDGTGIRYRMDGDEDVNGEFIIVGMDDLQKLYDAYLASGALKNDFTAIKIVYPCDIKE